jgi:hypothetical protein
VQLPHSRRGLEVALLCSPPDVFAGEAHVDVAEDAVAKHLAELVLGLRETLFGRFAYPSRSVEDVRLAAF